MSLCSHPFTEGAARKYQKTHCPNENCIVKMFSGTHSVAYLGNHEEKFLTPLTSFDSAPVLIRCFYLIIPRNLTTNPYLFFFSLLKCLESNLTAP